MKREQKMLNGKIYSEVSPKKNYAGPAIELLLVQTERLIATSVVIPQDSESFNQQWETDPDDTRNITWN